MTFIRLLTYASITRTSIQIQQALTHLHIYAQNLMSENCVYGTMIKKLYITIGDINLDLQRFSKWIIHIIIFIFDIFNLQFTNESLFYKGSEISKNQLRKWILFWFIETTFHDVSRYIGPSKSYYCQLRWKKLNIHRCVIP